MNHRHIRGLAALCLLCVLPRLGATVLTISQTAPLSYGMDPSNAAHRSGGQNVWFEPFRVPGAELIAVHYSATRLVDASVFEINFWSDGRPWYLNRAIASESYAVLTNGVHPLTPPRPSALVQDTPVPLAYLEGASFSARLDNSEQGTFTAPEDIAVFYGPTLRFQSSTLVWSPTYFGAVHATVSGQFSLTYEYRVPDAGAAHAMLFAALGLIGAFRLRFCRG